MAGRDPGPAEDAVGWINIVVVFLQKHGIPYWLVARRPLGIG